MPLIEQFIEAMDLTPTQRKAVDLVMKGHSLADICGLTREERDAVFLKACQFLQAGDTAKARQWLTFLNLLDPRDARAVYVMGMTQQTDGNFAQAAKLYVVFLALDPTNIEGYLRLGECHFSAREYDDAIACFEFVKKQCKRGKGGAAAAEHARRMLGFAKERAKLGRSLSAGVPSPTVTSPTVN